MENLIKLECYNDIKMAKNPNITPKLRDKLKQLPAEPGVYFHKNREGEVIYVGKAAILKNRVRQYFQSPERKDAKTRALVAEIDQMEYFVARR